MRPRSHIRRKIKRDVFARDGGKCFWCSTNITLEGSTVDHIVTASRGGSYHPRNLVLACFDCNQLRGDMPADRFLRSVLASEVRA